MNKKDGNAGITIILVIVIIILAVVAYLALTDKISLLKNEDVDINQENVADENKDRIEEDNFTNSKLMDLYEEKLSGQDRYAISDINGDNVPELITYKEDMSSDKIIANYILYSYVDGEVIQIGKIAGRIENNVLYRMDDNTLLVVYGHMGYEMKTTYKIEDNKLVEVDSTSRDVLVGEDYTTGDNIIPFDFTTDKIQFEVYR